MIVARDNPRFGDYAWYAAGLEPIQARKGGFNIRTNLVKFSILVLKLSSL